MQNGGVLRPWVAAVCLFAILAVFTGRCLDTARTYSLTTDEGFYLSRALAVWITGEDRSRGDEPGFWESGVPPLSQMFDTSVPYLLLRRSGQLPESSKNLLADLLQLVKRDKNVLLFPARCLAISWGVLTLLIVFWIVARAGGRTQGLIAAVLVSMVPEMLAHSARTAPDVPCAATMLIALLALCRYVEKPSVSRWMITALAVGVSWSTRHNAILLIPVAVTGFTWCELQRTRPTSFSTVAASTARVLCAGGVLLTTAFLVLWAADGFQTTPLVTERAPSRLLRVINKLGAVDASSLRVPTSVMSLKNQIGHALWGHGAYFCGQLSSVGHTLYFPLAFVLKTPIGLLILMILTAVRIRPQSKRDWILLGTLSLLWISLLRNKINIGLRYALLTYPLCMPFVARLFEKRLLRDRIWGPITLGATLLFAWESASCHPQYISYFNPLAGGTRVAWLYLADSNLACGQDCDALVTELRKRGITEVTVAEPGVRDMLNQLGFHAVLVDRVSPDELLLSSSPRTRLIAYPRNHYGVARTRFFALDANSMLGLRMVNYDESQSYQYAWLWTRRLVTRINDSVFLFDMDQPAESPFFR